MKTHYQLLERPGIYHCMIETGSSSPAQLAWLDRTCERVEAFTLSPHHQTDRPTASLVIHATADFLFERHGEQASFDKLDPAALIAHIVRELPNWVSAFAAVLRDFYRYLIERGDLDATRGSFLSCYFDTLLELHGSGPSGLLPTRASRRATATLARRITEARLRCEAREQRKRSAA